MHKTHEQTLQKAGGEILETSRSYIYYDISRGKGLLRGRNFPVRGAFSTQEVLIEYAINISPH